MKKLSILIFIFIFLLITIKSENPSQPSNNQNIQNNNNNTKTNSTPPSNNNSININNITNINTNSTNQINNTGKPHEKEFNPTESLIKFFNEMFRSNKTNNTNNTNNAAIEEAKKREEEKREEEENRRKKIEQIRIEAEKAQKERERQKLIQLEKEREEFEKQVENITVSEFTNLYLEGKSGELLYHNITQKCQLTIIFLLTDTEKTIHLTFNGPNGKGGSSLIKSFRSKNFLYYVHDAKYIGQYTFYLNNYHNSDDTEVIFAICDNLNKTDERLGKKNIDKISGYLNEIDYKINQMKSKQNLINKKTNTHNESINKHNREIIIYSIIEVITMIMVFVLQTCYIKNLVEKL